MTVVASGLWAGLNPPYRCIVVDPPWPSMHQRGIRTARSKPEHHYPTMTVDEIAKLDVGALAADDAHLWLWGVNRLLGAAYAVADGWGFTPMGLLTWCKRGPGLGYYLRSNTEHAVLATRGRPMVPARALLSSWYVWRRGRHSQKPGEFFALAEQVSPGPYVELFARQLRLGWDGWGNEVSATDPPAKEE